MPTKVTDNPVKKYEKKTQIKENRRKKKEKSIIE